VVGGATRTRRQELVEAAFRRVAEVGFEGLRLRQVSQEVGIDHSTLHHHFATKQELVEAVAEYATRQFFITKPDRGDPAEALRAHLEGLRRMMLDRPELLIVSAELDLRARRDPAVRAVLEGLESGWRAMLAELLAGAVPDPEGAAELVIATVKGVRLVPERAGDVFAQLTTLLLGTEQP
jgi:TetR/AcrR family transcriptional repressor of nem operon